MSFFRSNSDKQTTESEQETAPMSESATSEQEIEAGASEEARPSAGAREYEDIKADLIAAMKTVYDPEIPVDIYELGLIYAVDVNSTGLVSITMTLTTPMCPAAEILPPEVEAKTRAVDGVTEVQLELVWEPPWTMEMMSESARLELNL